MAEQFYKKSETITERRRLARYRLERVLNASRNDSLTPCRNLGWSLEALGNGQHEVLDELLRVFEQHPKTQDVANIAQHWADNMLKSRN